MSVLAIIQARVNSARLPRKSLAIIGCRASVFHVWKRAQLALGGPALVAVPHDDVPEFRAILPERAVVSSEFLAEDDVVGRFWSAARDSDRPPGARPPEVVVRLTADCPFVDPDGIRAVVAAVEAGADYATLEPIPNGLDAEAFSRGLLHQAWRANFRRTNEPGDAEHVTTWMRRHAKNMAVVPMFAHLPRYRWTLDTAKDLAWFTEVAREIDCTPPHPTVEELLALFERRPDLVRMDT